MGVTDLQVLQAFKKGQLELFYRRIYPGLLLYAVKNAGDRHDFLAEDCVQNAIFNAWKRRDSFDSIYTLKSFLYTSVKNEIISLYRKGKAQERYSSQLENEAFFANTVIDQETQLLLFNAIHSLPDRERQIFELSFIGWHFLGAITFGIAYIYVIPYFTFANTLYYQRLKEKRKS